jgi:hypothetical protein
MFLQSALTLKPTFTDAYNNMASALVQKGCIPQAMECYAAALRIDPNVVSCMWVHSIVVLEGTTAWHTASEDPHAVALCGYGGRRCEVQYLTAGASANTAGRCAQQSGGPVASARRSRAGCCTALLCRGAASQPAACASLARPWRPVPRVWRPSPGCRLLPGQTSRLSQSSSCLVGRGHDAHTCCHKTSVAAAAEGRVERLGAGSCDLG